MAIVQIHLRSLRRLPHRLRFADEVVQEMSIRQASIILTQGQENAVILLAWGVPIAIYFIYFTVRMKLDKIYGTEGKGLF